MEVINRWNALVKIIPVYYLFSRFRTCDLMKMSDFDLDFFVQTCCVRFYIELDCRNECKAMEMNLLSNSWSRVGHRITLITVLGTLIWTDRQSRVAGLIPSCEHHHPLRIYCSGMRGTIKLANSLGLSLEPPWAVDVEAMKWHRETMTCYAHVSTVICSESQQMYIADWIHFLL